MNWPIRRCGWSRGSQRCNGVKSANPFHGIPILKSPLDFFDRLDLHWKSRNQDDIRSILRSAENDGQPSEVCIDLCAADLEWRWRMAAGPQGCWTPGPLGESESMLTPTPAAKDYQPLLGPLWQTPDCRKQMLGAEWLSRSQFGDRPDVDQFADSVPSFEWDTQWLADLLDTVAFLQIDFHNVHTLVLTCPGPSEFTIGRATRDEPSAPAWNAEQRRAIIANVDYRQLSRTQLQVRRVRLEEIEVTNISKSAPVQLSLGFLEPGQSQRCFLPFRITFDQCTLQIRCERGE